MYAIKYGGAKAQIDTWCLLNYNVNELNQCTDKQRDSSNFQVASCSCHNQRTAEIYSTITLPSEYYHTVCFRALRSARCIAKRKRKN